MVWGSLPEHGPNPTLTSGSGLGSQPAMPRSVTLGGASVPLRCDRFSGEYRLSLLRHGARRPNFDRRDSACGNCRTGRGRLHRRTFAEGLPGSDHDLSGGGHLAIRVFDRRSLGIGLSQSRKHHSPQCARSGRAAGPVAVVLSPANQT
ncbi:MAG: hypothetical protein ACI8PT_002242 [Gammaproteobacteria bacterium]|jgi:hypothetical protein